jgi:hypothetical protein
MKNAFYRIGNKDISADNKEQGHKRCFQQLQYHKQRIEPGQSAGIEIHCDMTEHHNTDRKALDKIKTSQTHFIRLIL